MGTHEVQTDRISAPPARKHTPTIHHVAISCLSVGDALQRTFGNQAVGRTVAAQTASKAESARPTGDTSDMVRLRTRTVESIVQRGKAEKEKKTALGPYSRPQRSQAAKGYSLPVNFELPNYFGRGKQFEGNTDMEVILGPGSADPEAQGSVPGKDECSAVNELNAQEYGGRKWIKGHLLNENLGGKGVSHNLTPLSSDSNKAHLNSIESYVKNAITRCRSRAEFNKDDSHFFGVEYKVYVKGRHDEKSQERSVRAIGDHLECSAAYKRMAKEGGPIEDVDADEQDEKRLPDLPTGKVEVPCAL
jgi:hypothetical protein